MSDNELKQAENAVRTTPQQPEVWQHLGELYEARRELEKAKECFKRAKTLESANDSAKKGNFEFIRVAVVQFNYQPAAVLYYPLLEEPAALAEGEQGISSLHLAVPGFEDQLLEMRKEIATAYKEFVQERVISILNHLNTLDVKLVVFPEYSIPVDCLPIIEEIANNNLVVIAGSHTVTPESIEILEKLGIEIDRHNDIGKSICPIRIGSNTRSRRKWLRIDKITKSRWEASLKQGTVWHPISIVDDTGNERSFALFLCVDFINEDDRNWMKMVPREIWSQVDFGIVASYSPVIRDFNRNAERIVERASVPILYSNVANIKGGGSCIYCHLSGQGQFVTKRSTKPLTENDEAVIVVDLKIGKYSTVEYNPTPLPVPEPSRLVIILPILHKDKFPTFSNLSEKIRMTEGDDKKRTLVKTARDTLLSLVSSPDVPEALKGKIFELFSGIDWQDSKGLDNYVDYIPIESNVANLSELRFTLLHKSQKLLAGLMADVRLKGSEINTVTSILDIYRRHLDALRPNIRQEVLEKHETTSIGVIPSGIKKGPFTSVFLLRLRGAQSDRDALEKQIQLLNTLAYEGNENITFNLRYISIPNPSANLKNLDIDIIGAAQSDDLEHSKEIADTFRRDLVNLIQVTLHNVYTVQVLEIDQDSVLPITEPFNFTYIAELNRKVEYGSQPYLDRESSPTIYHLQGSSTFSRILNFLQSSPFACMISIQLRPCKLTEEEKKFFRTYHQAGKFTTEPTEGAMFYLGNEINPAVRISNVAVMRRMLGESGGLVPNLFVRLFIASDTPLSQLFINTVGSELWGNDTYQIHNYDQKHKEYEKLLSILRTAWADDVSLPDYSPPKLERVPYLFDPFEASRMFRLPLDGYTGAVGTLFSVLPAPAAVLPEEGIEIGLGAHPGIRKPIVVRLSERERTKHTYVIGKTGTGKSTLLGRMIEQDIENGYGVCVIDPHGDLVESVLPKIPENRIDDVILFDPAATSRPFGLNLLEYSPDSPHHKDFVVQETIAMVRKLMYFDHGGPMFEHAVRHLTLTMMDESLEGKGTLLEVPLLLSDASLRHSIVPHLKDELAKDYWGPYEQYSVEATYRSDYVFWIISRFATFTTDRVMRNIIGQSRSTINISDILNSQKILLVKLPSAVIGEINASLLGMILISKLRWAGMSRANIPPEERKDYYIYVDEFQNFATSGFETILAEARKYGLGLTMAHQHIGQLSGFNISTGSTEYKLSQAIFGNAGTMIVFRVGVNDAEFLARELGPPVAPVNLENMKNYHATVKTLISGEVYPPFTIQTVLSPRLSYSSSAEKIKQLSLKKYGRPKEEVEQEISDRLKRLSGDSRSQVEIGVSLLLNQPWLQPHDFSEQGILTGGNNKFDIGVVIALHVEREPEVLLLVKKSPRPDYELSNMWTLPGGIVRRVLERSILDYLRNSLNKRLEAETGTYFNNWGSLSIMNLIPPPVSSYNVNGQKKYTLVIPFSAHIPTRFVPQVQDTSSIAEASWRNPFELWNEIAPANRIIIGHYLWPQLNEQERQKARPFLEQAIDQCTKWANEIGVPPPKPPWLA